MSKWIAEFELEDGDTMPEHMDLTYMGAKIDFHCRPMWIPVSERLPNLDDYNGSKVWEKKVLITGYLSFDDTKDLFVSEVFAEDVIYNHVHDTVVIAWMPFPKPYKPQESEV